MKSYWRLTTRGNPYARELADRHYSRQKPGTPQFVPPGRAKVFVTPAYNALWVSSWPYSEYVMRSYFKTAWLCTLFRNEGKVLSSTLIREALAATRYFWGTPPEEGMITFIDEDKILSRNPGYCFLKAGFERAGKSPKGLHILRIAPGDMPEAIIPGGVQLELPLFERGRGVA